jgi:hypothetical protein
MSQKETIITMSSSSSTIQCETNISNTFTTRTATSCEVETVNTTTRTVLSAAQEEEGMIKRLSRIKLGSASRNGSSRQLMFKKNNASPSPTISPARSMPTNSGSSISSSSSGSSASANRMRTRSQSQGKCTKIANAFRDATSTACFSCISKVSAASSTNSYTMTSHLNDNTKVSSQVSAEERTIFTDSHVNKTMKAARADFFTWYSSVKGFVSHRDPTGSPFIRCLVAVLSRYAYELEIQEMAYKVHYLMTQYETINHAEPDSTALYMMTPVTENSLNKKLYFNP